MICTFEIDIPTDLVANAFLGGSRAYGFPTEASDTDIVVLVTRQAMDALVELTLDAFDRDRQGSGGPGNETSKSFRFGKLNLIATTNPREFDAWRTGTQQLIAEGPVTRGRAVEVLKPLVDASRQPNIVAGPLSHLAVSDC